MERERKLKYSVLVQMMRLFSRRKRKAKKPRRKTKRGNQIMEKKKTALLRMTLLLVKIN